MVALCFFSRGIPRVFFLYVDTDPLGIELDRDGVGQALLTGTRDLKVGRVGRGSPLVNPVLDRVQRLCVY